MTTRGSDLPAVPDRPNDESASWYNDAARGVQPAAHLPIPRETSLERSRHRARQYTIAKLLIALYAAGNVALGIGWFLGVKDVAIMASVVGNIGTLVAAVVAFYFAAEERQ